MILDAIDTGYYHDATLHCQITIKADVPLSQMFGYSTDIRSSTQGKGEFSMEYKDHQPVSKDQQEVLIKDYQTKQQALADE